MDTNAMATAWASNLCLGQSGCNTLARLMLRVNRMTNTDFIMREKSGDGNPLFKATQLRLRLVDGAIILGLMAAFVGMVLLLSK